MEAALPVPAAAAAPPRAGTWPALVAVSSGTLAGALDVLAPWQDGGAILDDPPGSASGDKER